LLQLRRNENSIFWVYVCNLMYPARNVHAQYCHPRNVWVYHIFPHNLTNGTIFGKKKLLSQKRVFWFILQIVHETFLILRKLQPNIIINVYRYSNKVPFILSDLHQDLIFATNFGKNIQMWNFKKILPFGFELFHSKARRTDKHAGRQTWRSLWNFSPLTH
jgi:hypothetical protein